MPILGRIDVKPIVLLGLALVSYATEAAIHRDIGVGSRRRLADTANAAVKVFDVTNYGAKGDAKTDSTMAFMKAWVDSCQTSSEPSKFVVPKGTFVTSPVVFQGPCKSSVPIIVEVQGIVKATDDLSQYSDDSWFLFERINGLVLTGGGTFDGQGPAVWKYNDCKKNNDCARLPSSIKFQGVSNSVVYEINSVNSKYFHFHISDSNSFTAYSVNVTAPGDSPNTDGMHISDTSGVNVSRSTIGTGDDCISIGAGVTNAKFSEIFCGPGHGISVGSLGKYQNEKDVNGIVVTNCTLSKTTNGVRIKTWSGSPPSAASSITFQDIIMDSVENPIIIDQNYGSNSGEPSHVKISDVHYKNIKGTSASNVVVSLLCSSSVPCQGIEMVDIDLTYVGTTGPNSTISASCSNAKVTSTGPNNPPGCI